MSQELQRSFDPQECLEMEMKEERSVDFKDATLLEPIIHVANDQPSIPWSENEEDPFHLEKTAQLENLNGPTSPVYKKNKEALYKLLLEDEECSFKCNQCPFETIYKIDILKHMKNHSKQQKIFPCSLCPYVASQKHHLQTHVSSRHTHEKPYTCNICTYTSATKAHLQTHLLTHSHEKPHKCPHCPYSTARKGNLSTHLVTHSDIKPHKCQYCPYAASQKTHLQSHMVIHTGEKPFACSHCSYSAAKKTSLQIHVKMTHTGEKPFACTECSYSTAQKGNLSRHIKIHEKDKDKPSYCQLGGATVMGPTGGPGPAGVRDPSPMSGAEWGQHHQKH